MNSIGSRVVISASLTCANALCLPYHKCVETSTGPNCVPVVRCSTLKCPYGTECVEPSLGQDAKCQSTSVETTTMVTGVTCAATSCEVGQMCIEGTGGKNAQCVDGKQYSQGNWSKPGMGVYT